MTHGRIHRAAALAAVLAVALLAAGPGPTPAAAQDDAIARIVVEGRGPRFGIQIEKGPPLVVTRVLPGSPAERGGVRAGDVILQVDGRAATYEVLAAAGRRGDGETVPLRIRRGGREIEVPVTLDSKWRRERVVVIDGDSIRQLTQKYLDQAREALRDYDFDFDFDFEPGEFAFVWPDSLGFRWPDSLAFHVAPDAGGAAMQAVFRAFVPPALRGAELSELNPGLARHFEGAREGVLVLDVEPDSRAAQSGLQAGDVIVHAGGEAVRDMESLHRWTRGRGAVELLVVRDGREVALRLER